jgi:hypothetical protein
MQILFLLQRSTQDIYVKRSHRTFNFINQVMARGLPFSLVNSSYGVKILPGMQKYVVG